MDKISVCINKSPYKDIGTASERRVRLKEVAERQFNVGIEEFAGFVGEKGYSFCPSTFNTKCVNKSTFQQTQLFVLTFDSDNETIQKHEKFSFDDILCRAKKYHLPILFAYEMYTMWEDSLQWRISVVFLNETPVIRFREAEVIQQALQEIFPEAENINSSVIDLRFGGKKLLYFDAKIPSISLDTMIMNLEFYWLKKYGQAHYKRKIAEFAKKTGIRLDSRKMLYLTVEENLAENSFDDTTVPIDENCVVNSHHQNGKNSPSPIISTDRFGEKLPRLNYHVVFSDEVTSEQDHSMQNPVNHQLYRSDMMPALAFRCELYRQLSSPESGKELSFQQLFGLATNLVKVETGSKTFLKILGKNPNLTQEVSLENWKFYCFILKLRNPYPCNSFCPYCRTCNHGITILSTCKPKRNLIERVNDEEPLVSLEEAVTDFNNAFYCAINSPQKVWYVIRSQTALGKTQTMLEYVSAHPEKKILIAVPTNILKREIQQRARDMGLNLVVSPSLHEIAHELPDKIWHQIEALLEKGKPVMSFITDCLKNKRDKKGGNKKRKQWKKVLENYVKERDEFYGSSLSAVTTHRRLASCNLNKYDLVIIDEDYIYSTVFSDRGTASLSALKKLEKKLPKNDLLRHKIRGFVDKESLSNYLELDDIEYNAKYDNIETTVNIHELCEATFFCCEDVLIEEGRIAFTKANCLPDGIKYIMLSATADEDICKMCFGEDNVRFYDCQKAELVGTLNQYYSESMSRRYLDDHPNRIEEIKKWSGFEHTITFKKYQNCCTDGLYFGNCLGCDVLKGEDIDVIGTPHQPDWIYKLFAFSLGLPEDGELRPHTPVVRNGYRFPFTTFDNEYLRDIQLYCIETELEQAVGRARLLRCDATVNVFSNFPLSQANLLESNCTMENTKGSKS